MPNPVLLETHNQIATLTLNRPERHNSLVPDFLREMLNALEQVNQQAELRALVLQANGRSFSTGGDVQAFYDHRGNSEPYAREIVGLLNQVIVAADRIRDAARAVAESIAQKKQGSIQRTKQLLWRDMDVLAARLEAERVRFCEQIVTVEAREGMATFLKK